jgi:hypothetical protein
VVVAAEDGLRWGIVIWLGNMSTITRPTQGVDLPRGKELGGTGDPEECGDICGRSGVDGGSILGIGGDNGDGDARSEGEGKPDARTTRKERGAGKR